MKQGDLVIVNQMDKPCARLLAVVADSSGQCYYLSAKVDQLKVTASLHNGAATLEEFGCEIQIASYQYAVLAFGTSCATYTDGRSRLWQEDRRIEQVQPLKPEFWPGGSLRYLLERQ